MKKAGTKNDGAWFRMNRALRKVHQNEDDEGLPQLEAKIAAIESLVPYLAALTDICTMSGISIPEDVGGAEQYAHILVTQGIPRQVWMGRLTFTTYVKTGSTDTNDVAYHATGQSAAHQFGKDLRKVCSNWLHARRQIKDVLNTEGALHGNPGGIANAIANAQDQP